MARVLTVDDSRAVRSIVVRQLKEWGVDTDEAVPKGGGGDRGDLAGAATRTRDCHVDESTRCAHALVRSTWQAERRGLLLQGVRVL